MPLICLFLSHTVTDNFAILVITFLRYDFETLNVVMWEVLYNKFLTMLVIFERWRIFGTYLAISCELKSLEWLLVRPTLIL